MQVTFWGTRGSIPAPGAATVRYGGNTSCVSVRLSDGLLLALDAGTGIRALGNAPETGEICAFVLLLSHGHWDHIQGFPFFAPAYRETCSIEILGGPGGTRQLRELLSEQMAHTFFPVQLDQMKARIAFDEFRGEWKEIGPARVSAIPLRHTGPGCGFRIEDNAGGTVVYLTDNELPAGKELSEGGPDWDFYCEACRNADLLIHDAQYLEEELPVRRGWGHSSASQATRLALDAGCRSLALFHHDPDRSDDAVDALTAACRAQAQQAGAALRVFAAAEGLTLEIGGASQEIGAASQEPGPASPA